METRAPYALIGLFVTAVIAAAFGFVYWLHNSGGLAERTVYQVHFENTVSGLLKRRLCSIQRHPRRRGDQSPARYQQSECDCSDDCCQRRHARAR